MARNSSQEYVRYLRRSLGRSGISRQRTVTTGYVEQELGGRILREFIDVDSTAFRKIGDPRPPRKDFDAMLAYLQQHPGVGVAAWHADRLTRDDEDTRLLTTVCAQGRHLVVTPRGGIYDLSTATGRKRLRDDASDAAYEVDHQIERRTAEKHEARLAGEWTGGPRPFGYLPGGMELCHTRVFITAAEAERRGLRPGKKIQTKWGDRYWVTLPYDEAKELKDAILRARAGTTILAITRDWNTRGVRTSTGRLWAQTEVVRVLRRARNAGLVSHDAKDGRGPQVVGKAKWPGVVERSEWEDLVAVFANPARRISPGWDRVYLLSGVAVCGICGNTLVGTKAAGKGRPLRPVYRCRPRHGKAHLARDVASLDAYITHLALGWIRRYGAAALTPDGNEEEAAHLRAELDVLAARLKTFTASAGRGDIDDEQLADITKEINKLRAPLQGRLAEITTTSRVPAIFRAADPEAVWENSSLAEKQEIIGILLTVTIHPAKRGRPAGWKPGQSYFRDDPDSITVVFKHPGKEAAPEAGQPASRSRKPAKPLPSQQVAGVS